MNIPLLKAAFKRLRVKLDRAWEYHAVASRKLALAEQALNLDECAARNYLYHTRVHGMSDSKGIGYGVTVFVREEALAAVRANPSLYPKLVQVIAQNLANRAVQGILNVNSRGQNCALLFDSKNGGAIGNVFDAGIRRAVAPGQSVEEYKEAERAAYVKMIPEHTES
jgi:hypothetical protein